MALHERRRREAELLVVGVLDMSTPDVLVGVENVDIACARGVRLAGDRTYERPVLDECGDREDLIAYLVNATK